MNKCLELIKEKGILNFREIYNILLYAKNSPLIDNVEHVYYIEYGLQKSKYGDISITMTQLIDEMHKHCDYWEAEEGFLRDLTIGCATNSVRADKGFIFYNDGEYNYFMNEEQMSETIKQWFKDGALEDEDIEEIYKILKYK